MHQTEFLQRVLLLVLSLHQAGGKSPASCGGIINGNNGTVSYYSQNYSKIVACSWIIIVDRGLAVVFKLHELTAGTCAQNYLYVYDGPSSKSPLSHVYCRTDEPYDVISTGNKLYVTFIPDSSMNTSGFQASFTTTDCGGVIVEDHGLIYSTNVFNETKRCSWRITVETGFRINFKLTSIAIPLGCTTGYIDVYDGPHDRDGWLHRTCGYNVIVDSIPSWSNQMYVRFIGDVLHTGDGFAAEFTKFSCGGLISGNTGSVSSPSYPYTYPSNMSCSWSINVDDDLKVGLKFYNFTVEGFECQYDYLEVYDGSSTSSPLLGRFCGNKIPNDVISTGSQLYLKFISDYKDQMTGFHATFASRSESVTYRCDGIGAQSVKQNAEIEYVNPVIQLKYRAGYGTDDGNGECGDFIEADRGYIVHINFFNETRRCSWRITVEPGFKINFNLARVEICDTVTGSPLTLE